MQTVLFLCPHGGARSVIASSYFNRLAADGALPFSSDAAATEEPYQSVPAPVAELLERDGFDVRAFQPRRVTDDDLRNAARVISIEAWPDVPMASVDAEGSAAAIRRHVQELVKELHGS